jgi:hypothetical protein
MLPKRNKLQNPSGNAVRKDNIGDAGCQMLDV